MSTVVPAAIIEQIQNQMDCKIVRFSLSGGGCINHGGKLETSSGDFFLKWNDRSAHPGMFLAESTGLRTLSSARALRIPEVIAVGETSAHQYLLLEFIDAKAKKKSYWKDFGYGLAKMHQCSAPLFGGDHENYIGSLPQHNGFSKRWTDFFIEKRLKIQLDLGSKNRLINPSILKRFDDLYKQLPSIFPTEKPSLLHGDLWSGNLITDNFGNACLIDPAVYYGNREADLAMTTLFGGFDPEYLASYNEVFPLIPGFEARFDIYNLYPLLVHVNLFGKSYLSRVVSILDHFV
jgi:fructosamine-3-kinase